MGISQMSNEKGPLVFLRIYNSIYNDIGYIGDYTIQLCGDYNEPHYKDHY